MKTLALALLLAAAATASAEKPCAEGKRDRTGTLGVQHYVCRGGSCWVTRNPMKAGGGFEHYFSTEPIAAKVEAGRELRDGDVLVSVDGVPVTTPEAGRHLANLESNVPVRLRIRRDGQERELVAVPRLGCEQPSLTVTSGGTVTVKRPTSPRPDFGMRLECGACGWEVHDGRTVWRSLTVPRVVGIDRGGPADVAGIRAGDRILSIDGHWTFEPQDGAAIGAIKPGQKVKVVVARGEGTVEVWVTTK